MPGGWEGGWGEDAGPGLETRTLGNAFQVQLAKGAPAPGKGMSSLLVLPNYLLASNTYPSHSSHLEASP